MGKQRVRSSRKLDLRLDLRLVLELDLGPGLGLALGLDLRSDPGLDLRLDVGGWQVLRGSRHTRRVGGVVGGHLRPCLW